MADTQETITDIIREARDKYTVHNCNECNFRKSCDWNDWNFGSVECEAKRQSISLLLGIDDDYFNKLLTRLEAAHKRERGDSAKLRDALEKVQKKIKYLIGNLTVPNSLVASRMEINGIINAALAEPPRNCDVFTPNECRERFLKFCGRHYCNRNCPYFNCKDANECVLAFAQSPCGSGESNREKGGDK